MFSRAEVLAVKQKVDAKVLGMIEPQRDPFDELHRAIEAACMESAAADADMATLEDEMRAVKQRKDAADKVAIRAFLDHYTKLPQDLRNRVRHAINTSNK